MDLHYCTTIVITCIDFRFQDLIENWLKEKFPPKSYDRVALGGGVKNLDTVLSQIDIAVKLHHIKKVVLINHEECGAYGAESIPQKHQQDLQKAKAEIKKQYPNLQVEIYYLKKDGTFENIAKSKLSSSKSQKYLIV